ncbi:MAG: bifunctional (p)ppGpp synthetase/guanosine-3',5'-bis(diphosphate) 3'-pyrophosphohydrolase [Nitrospirota bacterium]|jgi:guanosine-3',5'-bis(diphosphate) 3'-pyrophosphohydrolase
MGKKLNGKPAVQEVRSVEDLCRKVRSYNSAADTEFIKRAYWFASEAHGLQNRQDGSPYMKHPLEVASILADMRMDVATIAAGVLHDTIEDTYIHTEDIRKRFGYDLAFLVDALTKLSRMEYKSKEVAQAESFRKMLLSMSEDVRVILIKFADRLHNMRTLRHLPENKRHRIATETLEIYAPLANRLGMGQLRTEFEDLSFRFLLPNLHNELVRKVRKMREEHEGYIKALAAAIEKHLAEEGIPGAVQGRVKHYYGIYQKMQRQGIPFEQVHDVLGLRIITDTKANCYAVLGLVHGLWKPIPGKFKDYIGVPKSNMYRSLHTTAIAPGGERVEIQIRTEEMHRVAEEGIAAHWKYKERSTSERKDEDYVAWLRELVQVQKEEGSDDARAFLEAVKSEVVPDVIYVFTPKGDIKELPLGSTPVDFAYAIHTEVGHKCVGARVNGRMVPLRHQLASGNTVDVITSQTHKPSRDWLKFVVTTRAKNRIKQWFKTEERAQSIELGTRLLEDELKKHNLPGALMKDNKALEEVARSFSLRSVDDLLASLGYGKVSAHQVVNRLQPDQAVQEGPRITRQKKEIKGITIKGVDDVLYHTAKCCFPVPGDDLLGFITRGKGVAVHRSDCPNLERLAVDEARLIEVDWKPNPDVTSYARVVANTVDKPGIIAELSAVMSAQKVNISHLEATTSSQDRRARLVFVLEVRDKRQLLHILRQVVQMDGVLNVRRY